MASALAGKHGSAKTLGGLASKSYNVASAWEQTAALNEGQLQAIDALSQACLQRPFPSHVVEDQRFEADTAESHSKDTYAGTLEDAILHNTNQFHKWHTELEAACALEMEEKYKRYADLLNSHLQTCEDILSKVDSTLAYFDSLLAQHKEVSSKSRSLYSSCEQLVKEKDQLVEFADAIRTKLRFFDEFETVVAQFQKAQLSLDSEQFPQLLRKLDECMAFVASNPQYADAAAYTAKFKQIQAKALNAIRNKVQQVFRHAVQQVQAAIQEAGLKAGSASTGVAAAAPPTQVPVLAEGMEVSLLYVRFRAAAEASLKGLLRDIELRGSRIEYVRLMQECYALYAAARQQLITPFVSQRLAVERSGASLPVLTRTGCEHLLRACQLEVQLWEQFFPNTLSPAASGQVAEGLAGGEGHRGPAAAATASATVTAAARQALAGLTEPLCMLLYDVLRPAIIVLPDIDELCEMVDILKHEVLGDQLGRRGPGGEALRPTLSRALEDCQARLIFRCQAVIRDQVAHYTPTATDIDYPARLQLSPVHPAAPPDGSSALVAGHSSTPPPSTRQAGSAATPAPAEAGEGGADPFSQLYPPLHSTLLVLSKLYRAVDRPVFSGLAQEAVSACTLSVQQAGRLVARKAGPVDGQLFMIKHLLFLREQILPFDADFAVTDMDLDFSHMRDHMRRIMTGDLSIFSFGSSAGVMKMLGTAAPRVHTYQVDSKKELEKQLKSVCEAFIMAATKVAVEPMLSFITKVTALRVAAAANPAAGPRPLREQAFAAPTRVAEMVAKVNEAIAGPLPTTIAKMKAYLGNPATHTILFKPVKSNICEAHGQVGTLLAAEYLAEEAASTGLKHPHELEAELDAMC
ncbi:component of oligomeric golgi complex 3 [Haematococcus lacustris]